MDYACIRNKTLLLINAFELLANKGLSLTGRNEDIIRSLIVFVSAGVIKDK